MTDFHLASVEERISSWIEAQKKRAKSAQKKPSCITLSRQFGCEAYPLALSLKEALEKKYEETWTIFDKKLIDKICEDRNISKELLSNLGSRSGFFDSLIRSLNAHWQSESELYEVMLETIHGLAQGGNCIFVGHGAAAITQDLEECFHFRLEAPLEFRVNSLVRRLGVAPKEAKSQIALGQKIRDGFINKMLALDLSDSHFYHLILNNEKLSVERMTRLILALLEQEE